MADRRSRSPQRSDRSRSPPRQQRARSPARGGGRQDGKGEVLKGKAGRWNDKGFCFILPDGAAKGEDIFCHFSAITDGNCLSEGDPVEFEKSWDDNKQKYRAANVTGGHTEDRRAPSGGGFGGGRGGGGSGPCYSFRDGKCTRGSSCRFSHESGGGGGSRGGGGRSREERPSYGGSSYGGSSYGGSSYGGSDRGYGGDRGYDGDRYESRGGGGDRYQGGDRYENRGGGSDRPRGDRY